MQPVLVHHCNCTYDTPVPFSSSVFSENIACANCGSISTGINIQPKSHIEANMQQDELARLFSAHMTLSQGPPIQQVQKVEQVEPQQSQDLQQPNQIVYASTHYTHSHHVAPARSASTPSAKTQMNSVELAAILLRNSIDPSRLFPSQVELFQGADDDQRLRLLELWRISPPSGRQGYPPGCNYNMSRQLYDWPPTSLAQEEAMAKLRYEKVQQEEQDRVQQEHIRQHQEQLDRSMATGYTSPSAQAAEPYMTSGYEMMAQREYEQSSRNSGNALKETSKYNHATDPVYNNDKNGLWQKNIVSMLDMENNYGAFAYARENGFQSHGDEEMVM